MIGIPENYKEWRTVLLPIHYVVEGQEFAEGINILIAPDKSFVFVAFKNGDQNMRVEIDLRRGEVYRAVQMFRVSE